MTRTRPPGRGAVVVGAGPNGLAAAITLARARRYADVVVLEAAETPGGGVRTVELTRPGFRHDVCSAVHPLGVASPFFRSQPLADFGLRWVHPQAPLAHPLDGGRAVVLERSPAATGATLGADGVRYRRLLEYLTRQSDVLLDTLLRPLHVPRRPLALLPFGPLALLPATLLARLLFREAHARALFAGIAAHSIQPLEHPLTSAFGLLLGMLGHAWGWPFPRGGSGEISRALADCLRALGGDVRCGVRVRSLAELQPAGAVLLDVTPRQVLEIAGPALPSRYRRQLSRYRYGPGVFKVDWALDGPVPWQAPACARAGTLHLGGTLEEIAAAERAVWRGEHPEHPFVLAAQPSRFDETRAPAGKHTLWAYCHVPHGSTQDVTECIERQIERFAPGFRGRILARHTFDPASLQRYNANYVGGDVNGGIQDLGQLYTRPVPRLDPYATPVPGLFLCSSSTPPGGGVHGMCGVHAARSALRRDRPCLLDSQRQV